jgi:MarC family integral membrane protein
MIREPAVFLLAYAFTGYCILVMVLSSQDFAYGEDICTKSAEYEERDACKRGDAATTYLINPYVDSVDNAISGFHSLVVFLNEIGTEVVKAVITLFVVIDPIGIVPLFATFTEKMQPRERRSISQTATITAGILLFVFAIAGTQIFAVLV